MALQNFCAPGSDATRPSRINERSTDTATPADPDGVLLSGGGFIGIVAAADARAEEEVVVRAAVVHEAPLQGVVARAVICNLVARGGSRLWRVVHWSLVDFLFMAESVRARPILNSRGSTAVKPGCLGNITRPRIHALLTIAPETAKVHVVAPIRCLDERWINRVIRLRRGTRNPRRAVVRPGAVIHRRGSSISDG